MDDRQIVLSFVNSVRKELNYALEKLNEATPGIGLDTYKLFELIGSARAFTGSAVELLDELTKELSTPE
jgi:hypothetical protein